MKGLICAVEEYCSQQSQYFCLSTFVLSVKPLSEDYHADRQSHRKSGPSELGICAMIHSA